MSGSMLTAGGLFVSDRFCFTRDPKSMRGGRWACGWGRGSQRADCERPKRPAGAARVNKTAGERQFISNAPGPCLRRELKHLRGALPDWKQVSAGSGNNGPRSQIRLHGHGMHSPSQNIDFLFLDRGFLFCFVPEKLSDRRYCSPYFSEQTPS